jgi:hypothetical protein
MTLYANSRISFRLVTAVIANMLESRVHNEKLIGDYESSVVFNYDGFTME